MKTDWSKYTMTGYEMDIVQAISILQAEKAKQIEYRKLRFFPWKKVRHLQVIGITHPARAKELGIESCAYFSDVEGHLLMIGPPENKIQMYLNSCTKELNILEVSYTQVQNLKLSHLTGITTLNLSENVFLSRVEGIAKLVKLQQLVLFHTAVGPELDINHNLELELLHIGGTNIIRVEISHDLPRMRSFLAQNSKICSAECISSFPGVKYIDFSSTHIEKLPSLDRLIELEQLALQRCAIKELPQIENLSKLRILWLINTAISSLDNIVFPNSLDALFLGGMRLKKLPNSLRLLDNLSVLDLSYICLDELPDWLPELNLNFYYLGYGHGINLKGAKIQGINMSIFDQSQETILKWFEERRKANTGAPLNEVKVVFLGDGEAGKSHCIARLLKGGEVLTPEETPNDSTPGIVITDQSYRIGDRDVQVHFWDFGGQEILHSMHRMFLTERTLYVILINARDDTQDDRARYWLHNVRSFADGAPVLLVLNKMDQNPNASVNETDLRSIYPGLTEVVKLSARFDDQEKFNGSFTEAMKRQIGKMDNLGFFFPASWTRAKQRLLGMTDNYIMGSDYALICEESGIADEGDLRRSLLNWFNDLGVSICYSRHIRLKDYVILRPNWITNAVYAILFNKHPDTSNGIISHDAIFEMIQPPGAGADPYRRTNSAERYTQAEIDYILGVTRKFRLSFQVDDAHEFIPMLCQRESLPIAAEYAADPDALEFRMTFDYLPSNVLHRLMVELRQDLDTSHVWRTGARFAQKSSGLSALVKTGGNELRIFVRGTKQTHWPNTYLCILKDAIDRIVGDMNLAEPVNEVIYKLEGRVQAFDYDELVESLDAGETTRYSRAHKRRLQIEDILNQTGHQPEEARKQLLEDMMTACAQMQANRQNWDAYEDDRNTYIRDLLRAKGYFVADQTFSGEAAGGKRAGELDLLIMDAPDRPWTLCEAMNLSGKGRSQIEYWNTHLQKLLGCYDANGMPFLFLISYVDCATEKFDQIVSVYYEHLRFYSPGAYTLQSVEPLPMSSGWRDRNQYIRSAGCTYDREGFPTTVYHIFVRMGS